MVSVIRIDANPGAWNMRPVGRPELKAVNERAVVDRHFSHVVM
jgi:hypothetical protein